MIKMKDNEQYAGDVDYSVLKTDEIEFIFKQCAHHMGLNSKRGLIKFAELYNVNLTNKDFD